MADVFVGINCDGGVLTETKVWHLRNTASGHCQGSGNARRLYCETGELCIGRFQVPLFLAC